MEAIASNRQMAEAWARRQVFGGVLIGGSSTRMGQAKSLLRYRGRSFVELVIEVLRERTERVVLLGEGQTPVVSPETARVPDPPGLAGPLAGILAALRWRRDVCWIMVACDLPLLRVEALDWLLEQRQPNRWAILPKVDPARVEPLLAVYEPQSLELLEQLVASGRRCPRHIEGHPAVHAPTPPRGLCACWTNINTPEDFDRLGR
jgi:molybdopterin-guanine dinucleotide biosynthesis protein A